MIEIYTFIQKICFTLFFPLNCRQTILKKALGMDLKNILTQKKILFESQIVCNEFVFGFIL